MRRIGEKLPQSFTWINHVIQRNPIGPFFSSIDLCMHFPSLGKAGQFYDYPFSKDGSFVAVFPEGKRGNAEQYSIFSTIISMT